MSRRRTGLDLDRRARLDRGDKAGREEALRWAIRRGKTFSALVSRGIRRGTRSRWPDMKVIRSYDDPDQSLVYLYPRGDDKFLVRVVWFVGRNHVAITFRSSRFKYPQWNSLDLSDLGWVRFGVGHDMTYKLSIKDPKSTEEAADGAITAVTGALDRFHRADVSEGIMSRQQVREDMNRRLLEERILVLMERTRGSVRTEMRSYPDDLRARYEELARWKPDDTAVSDERFDVRSLVSSVQRQLGGKWARLINDKDFSSANKVSRYLDSLRFEDDLVTPKPDAEKYAALHRRVNEYMSWLMDRIGSGQKSLPEITRDEIERWVKEMVVGTQKNMNRLARFVQAAVNRVEDWGGTRLVIVPAPDFDDPDSEDVSEPVETFLVEFQTGHRERAYNPYFMLFTSDGKFEHIDNVLHAGDPDFFKGGAGGDEHDYFRLVSEIRDPGSTSRKGRDVVIWTARPTKDRKLYQQATRIPAGIFVTNDPDRAWGIAYDLGGGEVRDLWRIVINSRYLHETLRAGRVRDYQVVGRGKVPVKEAQLWAKGKSRRR